MPDNENKTTDNTTPPPPKDDLVKGPEMILIQNSDQRPVISVIDSAKNETPKKD